MTLSDPEPQFQGRYITSHLGQLSLPSIPTTTDLPGWIKAGRVHLCLVARTLCDLMAGVVP